MTKWSTFTYLLGSHKQLLPADLCPPTSTRYLVTCLTKPMRSKCGVSVIHINKQILHKHRYQVDIKAIHMDNTLVYREAGLSMGVIIIIIIIIIIILNKLVRAGLYTLKSVWVFSVLLSLSISYGADKENVYTNQESLGDHFPYSRDVNVWFRSDIVIKNLLLVTLRD